MSIERRLRKLEGGRAEPGEGWVTPIEVRILTKAVARHNACKDGREPPTYTQEEILHLRDEDLKAAVGGGVVGQFRDSGGWQTEEAREALDSWEEGARRRLAAMEDLSPERWGEVYEHDEEEEELHDE